MTARKPQVLTSNNSSSAKTEDGEDNDTTESGGSGGYGKGSRIEHGVNGDVGGLSWSGAIVNEEELLCRRLRL